MRTLVLSDIHGSALATKKALDFFELFNCDKIFLLGDILYHGPRNPLPGGHDPMGVSELLNNYASVITAVRGNCDAEVDQMMLDFPCMADFVEIQENNSKIFLSHGHLFDPYYFSHYKADIYLSGHTHIYTASKNPDGVFTLNPGSISLPKAGNPPTFGILETKKFTVHLLEKGEEIKNICF